MHSERGFRWAVGGVVGFAVVLAMVLLWSPPGFREAADQYGSALSIAPALIGLPVAWFTLRALRGGSGSRPASADDVVERLAGLVARQWDRESVRRGLRGSAPMRIRWRVTGRPVGVPPGEVVDLDGVRVKRLRLEGEVTDLAAAWRRLPFRRMVVIGGPGAGKTSAAVLLTCALLAERKPGEPVPVLLDVAGWRPSAEAFEVWLGRTLSGRYGLRAISRQAGLLVAERSIVAVLDGLDEMRVEDRVAAVTALNELVDLPLVVLSRAEEYTDTVARTGEPLNRALIVELDPLAPQQAAGYLPAGQAGDAGRWAPVARNLAEDPDGPLAVALSSPLLTYLARTVYRVPGSDPAELIAYAAAGELERRLFGRYLPALYAGAGSRWPAARAEAWLRFLARFLEDQESRDFAWWRIGSVGGRPVPVARWTAMVVISLPFVLLSLPALGGNPTVFSLLAVAVMIVLVYQGTGNASPDEPRQFRFQWWLLGRSIVGGMLFCVPSAVWMVRPAVGLAPVVVCLGLLSVLAVWLNWAALREGSGAGRRESPGEVRFRVAAVAFLVGVAFLASAGSWEKPEPEPLGDTIVAGLTAIVTAGPVLGLFYGMVAAFVRTAPEDELSDPDRTLREDRRASLVPPVSMALLAVVGALAGLSIGLWSAGATPVWRVLLTAAVVAAVAGWYLVLWVGASAWFTYMVVRLWFAARGLLPWRLMPFLADAARRGVLRRNGAVYQFRHARLQSHLAGAGAGGVRRLE